MKWIPVKDRLPEVSKMVYEGSKWMQPIGFADYFLLSDWVLVTADADSSDGDDTEIFVAQYEDDLDGRTYWTTIGAGLLNNVTAWMPLPQPYKADRKTEPQTCDTCKFADKEWYEEPCNHCGYMGRYEPKNEPQTDCSWK